MKTEKEKKETAKLLVRNFPCGVCGGDVLYYPQETAIRCKCGIININPENVNLELFEVVRQ